MFLLGPSGRRIGINQIVWEPATNTLHVESDEQLKARSPYLLIVTRGVHGANGEPLDRNAFRRDVLFGQPVTAAAQNYRRQLGTALAAAAIAGVHPSQIAGASLFTTQSIAAISQKIRAQIRADLGATSVEHIERPGAARGPVGPAEYFTLGGGAHHGRRFGTIAAMTENFCGTCNRLRVSATGQLHACLARDDTGDVRAALRSGDPGRLEQVVRAALGVKRDTHGFELGGGGGPNKAMISIGG